jgi:3-phenylpropionate/cinnamic acid dioxygenase small subunit
MSHSAEWEIAQELIFLEAHHLDQKAWDDWLDLYTEDAVFWMPSWVNEFETTTQPETELNLLYLKGKSHLEDRVYRLQTEDSFASVPSARTVHLVSNVRVSKVEAHEIKVHANWLVHSYGLHGAINRGGYYDYTLRWVNSELKIAFKKVTMIDDKLVGPVDIFHV